MPAFGATAKTCATLLLAISVLAGPTLSPAAAGGAEIGQVKTVSGKAFILRDAARNPVKIGDTLFEKDVIETGADGSIGITFVDNTMFSAGPNSQVALEEFNFDSSNFKGSMTTDVNRGTVSVVSGDIARSSPGAMKVKTPTAILGVRGTVFAVQVGDAK